MSNSFAHKKGGKLSLEEVDTLSELNDKPNKIWQSERFLVAALLLLISVLTLSDLIEDRLDGAPFTHLLVEALVIGVCIAVAMFFWSKSIVRLRVKNQLLSFQLSSTRQDSLRWKQKVGKFSQGLTGAILDQFHEWGLSVAESDVAFLLLKGFSLKEIAALRKTTEQTVRQQAAAIYGKSQLDGRAQLSAFFLEDLLVPSLFPGESLGEMGNHKDPGGDNRQA